MSHFLLRLDVWHTAGGGVRLTRFEHQPILMHKFYQKMGEEDALTKPTHAHTVARWMFSLAYARIYEERERERERGDFFFGGCM